MKKIPKAKLTAQDDVALRNEVRPMQTLACRCINCYRSKAHKISKMQNSRAQVTLASRLRHPNIVQLVAANETTTHYFLVMELMAGGTLSDSLNDQVCQTFCVDFELCYHLGKEPRLKRDSANV